MSDALDALITGLIKGVVDGDTIKAVIGVDPSLCEDPSDDVPSCFYKFTDGYWLNSSNGLYYQRCEHLLNCPTCSPQLKPEAVERLRTYTSVLVLTHNL